MTTLIVSLSATLGSEVFIGKGNPIAVVYDVICNKDTGKITYFILCPLAAEEKGEPAIEDYYAVHHSYFYFDDEDEVLNFSGKLGNDEHSFFLDLPQQYDDSEVKDLAEFNRLVIINSAAAGHRSDND
ncbi:hypothetical protein CLV84_0500 [Neolewinella xylanilytica]|uniref:Uncharacterized protein n=1 Tax=Neolewinella xylanilytica TaxID=1514080 RepID=A0A2S6I7T1_9BACT|nr:hypothetical protein [Neolewinella xylanilytica]PPK87557.1 hypothetical protein CLV84_0500 [Neolewinella xylanilytica]